jgi:hypothetical protein
LLFRDGTVFIVGAGASAEFGLPVGSQLAKKIKTRAFCLKNLNNEIIRPADTFVEELLQRHYGESDRYAVWRALDVIGEGIGTAVSIDAFIDRYKNNPVVASVGKLLIAIEIALAERSSNMHPKNAVELALQPAVPTADDTWIGNFTRILLDGVDDPSQIGKGISIICFNYDRCIEFYLTEAISAAYDIDIGDAQEIVGKINIIHPYGTLGALPTYAAPAREGVLPFGPELDQATPWFTIADNHIRTYTQQAHNVESILRIHEAIGRSVVMVFLGFGFNNQNLDLLRVREFPGVYKNDPRQVYSSGLGVEKQVSNTLKRRIGNLFGRYLQRAQDWSQAIHIEHGQSCGQLFQTHFMNLASFTERYVDHEQGMVRVVGREMD